jgi:dipeptidyl aminopeptidase/acylaminoacyl peptidase
VSTRTRIPLEVLFGNPEKASPRLSPDGKRLAWLAPVEGVLNIWCDGKPVTADRGRGIRSYFWAEDGSLLYVQDKDGDENWHLWRVNGNDLTATDLTPYTATQCQIVATDPKFPHDVLITLNKRDARLHDAYRLDVRTGALTLEAENPGTAVGWLADPQLAARAAKTVRADGGGEIVLREGSGWRPLVSWGYDDQGGAHGFTPDGRALYLETSLDRDTTALFEQPLDGGPRRLLAAADGADLGAVLLHPRDYHAEAVSFVEDRLRWQVLDERLRPDFEALAEQTLGDLQIASRDDDDTAWIVLDNSDVKPPRFLKYDRKTRKTELLFSTRPKLDAYELAPMKPVEIKARDGLRLNAYLTVARRTSGQRLPLVLLVHGGPWARDSWGFQPEAQWLADQGYAVLQVNFRGSVGFGKRFLHAGDREWGAKMQDDLTDAALWAVERGVADRERLAIFGGSYGGYAALAGAAFTPDLFRCAVDVVGPSNLVTLVRSIPPYWEPMRKIFDLRMGNVDTEREFLESRSPLFFADRIQIPLLIAQGANDPRVKQAESEMIVEALRSRGKPVEYLLFPDEGHGFARPENRLKFYAAAERFLAAHLR